MRIKAVVATLDMVGGGRERRRWFHVTRGADELPELWCMMARGRFAEWVNEESVHSLAATGKGGSIRMVAPEGWEEPASGVTSRFN